MSLTPEPGTAVQLRFYAVQLPSWMWLRGLECLTLLFKFSPYYFLSLFFFFFLPNFQNYANFTCQVFKSEFPIFWCVSYIIIIFLFRHPLFLFPQPPFREKKKNCGNFSSLPLNRIRCGNYNMFCSDCYNIIIYWLRWLFHSNILRLSLTDT